MTVVIVPHPCYRVAALHARGKWLMVFRETKGNCVTDIKINALRCQAFRLGFEW